MFKEQPQGNRQRNSHKRRNAYHAPADMTGLQHNIAAVTLDHVRQGKAADYRNLQITYPVAFGLVYEGLSRAERIETGMACNEAAMRRRMVEREQERAAITR